MSRSRTTAEIDTFINDVSITNTNIAIASRRASRPLAPSCPDSAPAVVSAPPVRRVSR